MYTRVAAEVWLPCVYIWVVKLRGGGGGG
eukprot:COSAG01_NODE_81649_length_109_cov_1115.200000_1_plen_28_part_01